MRKNLKKIILISVVLVIALLVLFDFRRNKLTNPQPVPQTSVTYTAPTDHPSNTNTNNNAVSIPESLLIKVPFTPQAPTANWDELHNEACEEASSIMANAYFNNITSLSTEYVETEITKLTEWQDQNQGYHLDQTSGETSKMIEMVYGLQSEIDDLSETMIKKALTENKVVLVSFNGRLLGNPHYKQPGPIHHMLVITGWTKDRKFVTNDPGTKFGANYQYDWATLYNAAADWDHNTNNVNGTKKFAIIVSNK